MKPWQYVKSTKNNTERKINCRTRVKQGAQLTSRMLTEEKKKPTGKAQKDLPDNRKLQKRGYQKPEEDRLSRDEGFSCTDRLARGSLRWEQQTNSLTGIKSLVKKEEKGQRWKKR